MKMLKPKMEAEKILDEFSKKEGVIGTVVTTSDGIPIRSDFSEDETNLYSSLVAHFVQRTKKALDAINGSGEPETIRIRSKKNEIIIAPYNNYIFIVVQDPFSSKK